MIIANPLYDVTFKRLLSDNQIAKILIGTIIDCEILSLEPSTIERTYEDNEKGSISLLLMDFAAIIEAKKEGKKKVLIELQKAIHQGDIMRFRRYLGKEYMDSELPIITIYILGFNLLVDSPAFLASPECVDLVTKAKLEVNETFVRKVTHQAYFIQTLRIKASSNSRLEKLLTIFEQANFIGNGSTTKSLNLDVVDTELKEIVNTLRLLASDEETKVALEHEAYYHQYMEEKFGDKDRLIAKYEDTITVKNNQILENNKALSEKDKALSEKEKALSEKEKTIITTVHALSKTGMTEEEIANITNLSPEQIGNMLN